MMQAAQRQYIEGYCNVGTTDYTFSPTLSGTLTNVTVYPDANGYWRWYKPKDKYLSGLFRAFTSISQAESNKLTRIKFHLDLSRIGSCECCFGGVNEQNYCSNLVETIGLAGIKPYSVMRFFQRCGSLQYLDVSSWDFSSITSLYGFCASATSLEVVGIETIDVSRVTNFTGCFHANATRIIDISSWSIIQGANLYGLFADMPNLTTISLPAIGGGSSVQNMFRNCTALTTILSCGNIGEITYPLSFANSPLTLQSAITVLNALQDVTSYGGATLTFSSTTKGYINNDATALALVANAVNNLGWTIALN